MFAAPLLCWSPLPSDRLTCRSASPYIPATYGFHDPVFVGDFEAFAELAGCGKFSIGNSTVFDCLVAVDSAVLKNASGTVSDTREFWGSWAFLPVVDGEFIVKRPSATPGRSGQREKNPRWCKNLSISQVI